MSSARRSTAAVVGAGVSGLTAAHVLNRTHHVTVFEGDTRVGGHEAKIRESLCADQILGDVLRSNADTGRRRKTGDRGFRRRFGGGRVAALCKARGCERRQACEKTATVLDNLHGSLLP